MEIMIEFNLYNSLRMVRGEKRYKLSKQRLLGGAARGTNRRNSGQQTYTSEIEKGGRMPKAALGDDGQVLS